MSKDQCQFVVNLKKEIEYYLSICVTDVRADPRTPQTWTGTVQNFIDNILESKQTTIRKPGR